jgi:tellurite resistance protein TehA-like permease
VRPDAAFGGWLMPVVPPMVSAAGGALLIPYAPAGEIRTSLLYACYTMFGLSLIAAMIIITMIWSRLAHYGTSKSVRVPTLWIVLGPLGQSITAAGALGTVAILAVPPDLAQTMNSLAIIYGVPVWGFAGLWSCLAALLTIHAYRSHLPFALTWWAFTFPVGTCVTGTSQLAKHTGLTGFAVGAVAGFVLLLGAWLAVGLQTSNRSWRGTLLHKQPAKPIVSQKG